MRIKKLGDETAVWLSANDTYQWAHRVDAVWPCSTLSGHRVFARFAANGDLVDFALDGDSQADCDAHEFNACIDDLVGLVGAL